MPDWYNCSKPVAVVKLWAGLATREIHHEKILNVIPNQSPSIFIPTFFQNVLCKSYICDINMPPHQSNFQLPDGMLESFRLHQGIYLPFTLSFKYGQIDVFALFSPFKKRTLLAKICLFTITSTI